MPHNTPTANGMAKYLESCARSPYSYPASDRVSVAGVSTLKGSWRRP